MKVVVLGGYGVFGSLLAKLLARDGHLLWLAGRNPSKAKALAQEIGAEVLQVDARNSPEGLFAAKPDVIIDAAGPFQFYGDDPYKIARLCVENGVHYLDLSDASDFAKGIEQLDTAAESAGVFVLSGASSVPGLSSCVVSSLSKDFEQIELIDIAILPGNRAPRGRSVIESITSGVGRTYRVWRGNKWRDIRGWTDGRSYTLDEGLTRRGYFVDVPDISLLPTRTSARSVVFRAGLELWIMNWALRGLAALRKWFSLPLPSFAISILQLASKALYPLGTDRGGMQVKIVGSINGEPYARKWSLIAKQGDGPFIPGIMCRALLREPENIATGARVCLGELPLERIESAMDDLQVHTKREQTSCPSVFQSTLGQRWAELPQSVRSLHKVQDVVSFSGQAKVIRGRGLGARLIAGIFGFPQAAENIAVTVTKTRIDDIEIWQRDFGGKRFRSHLSQTSKPQRIVERFGIFRFELELPIERSEMKFEVRRGWCLGVPIPRVLLPISEAREFERDQRFHFDVALIAPLSLGLIVQYQGYLFPEGGGE